MLSPRSSGRAADQDSPSEKPAGCSGQTSSPEIRVRSAEVPARIRAALPLLLQAHDYARLLRCDPWDYAVELPNLCAAGLDISDLRWLVYEKHISPAEEVFSGEGGRREFRDHGRPTLSPMSSFVLSQRGVAWARRLLEEDARSASNSNGYPKESNGYPQENSVRAAQGIESSLGERNDSRPPEVIPIWDIERRELRIGKLLVKQFRLPSPNQERVLCAFEEEGWPARIDDPLPRVPNLEPKRRLHDTIKSLNRHQKNATLRFMGDGSGEGVLWECEIASLIA